LLANSKKENYFSEYVDVSDAAHQSFTKLGIKVKFTNLLSNFDTISGDYGIRIYLIGSL